MPVSVSYDVDGVAQVEHMLLGMGMRAIQTRPLLEMFGDTLEEMMTERFAAQGEGDWAPLADSTVRRKGSSTIGRETDAMMDALTSKGAEGALREVFGDELIFGINLTDENGVPYPSIFDKTRPIFNTATMDLGRFTKQVHAYLVAGDRSEFGVGSFGMSATTPFGV